MENENQPLFKSKEEFVAEVDKFINECEAVCDTIYDIGKRMAGFGMLSNGLVEAFVGAKATSTILQQLKDGDLYDELMEKIKNESNGESILGDSKFDIPKTFGKYLN